jgi:hypothetical protein
MNRGSVWIMFYALSLALQQCAEPKTGCLDVRATNFQVDADEGCTDCCTYPQLRLDLLHKFTIGDSLFNFIPGNTYSDAAGNRFRLGDLRFYLTEIRLTRSDGTALQLEKQLALRKANANGDSTRFSVEDNFALASPASLLRILPGNFRDGGTFTGVKFKIGVAMPARSADPASAPVTHSLYPQQIPMWTAQLGYLSQRIEVYLGQAPADTLRRILEYGGPESVNTVALPFDKAFPVPPGFHITLTLRVDYARWLRNVNFGADTDSEIFRKLSENLPGAFSVSSTTATSN